MAVITNDIYTKEDAEFLVRRQALPAERVVGVETGGCPHTAIREDASVNLEAVRGLTKAFPALDLLLVEASPVDASQGLALHELAQQLNHGQHEMGEPLLEPLGIGVDAGGHAPLAKLYGGQGPTAVRPASLARAENMPAAPRSTRYAVPWAVGRESRTSGPASACSFRNRLSRQSRRSM